MNSKLSNVLFDASATMESMISSRNRTRWNSFFHMATCQLLWQNSRYPINIRVKISKRGNICVSQSIKCTKFFCKYISTWLQISYLNTIRIRLHYWIVPKHELYILLYIWIYKYEHLCLHMQCNFMVLSSVSYFDIRL